MAGLPALSDSTNRKLAIQWDTIRDIQKLTDEDLAGYDRDRQRRLLGIVGDPPRVGTGLLRYAAERAHPDEAAHKIGLNPSVRAAEAQFRQADSEYWSQWSSTEAPYEEYAAWLDNLKRDTVAKLASVWNGRSDVTDCWFQSKCVPAIEKALTVLLKKRVEHARDVESARLERGHEARPPGGHTPHQGIAEGAMSDTSFWREAEARFRGLQAPPPQRGEVSSDRHNGLKANWSRDGWSDSGKPWYLNNADDAIKKLFTWAAESAAVELGHPGGEEALFFWLDLLRRDSPFFKPFGVGGYIFQVCNASAEYCIKCETDVKAARLGRIEDREQAGVGAAARTSEVVVPIRGGTMLCLQELPPRYQDAFESAKAKAELRYANRGEMFPHHPQFAESPINYLVMIQNVFFAYCQQARNACREGIWSVTVARSATEEALPLICDHYFVRKNGDGFENRKAAFRTDVADGVWLDAKGKQHLSELAALADDAATAAEIQAPGKGQSAGIVEGTTSGRNTISDRDTEAETIAAIMKALDRGERKKAVGLRIEMEGCTVKTLWLEAFSSRRGRETTKRTAFNRWQASRSDTPSWADELIRARLLKPVASVTD